MEHDEITCKQFIRTLAEFLAGELDSGDERRSELHLEVCPDCVRYLKDYEVTIRLGAGSREDEDAAMPADLARVILTSRKK